MAHDHYTRASTAEKFRDLLRMEGFPSAEATRVAEQAALETHRNVDRDTGTGRLRTSPTAQPSDLIEPWPWAKKAGA